MTGHSYHHVRWRVSSYSGTQGNCVEVADLRDWRVSSYSGTSGNCVEVAALDHRTRGGIGVRDSKDRGGPVLVFTLHTWRGFVTAAKTGHLTRP